MFAQVQRSRLAVLGFAIGVAFLALAVRHVDLAAVGRVLSEVAYLPLLGAVIATFLFMATKAWRWAIILRPAAVVPPILLHSTTYIGSASNLLIPHSGELIRSVILSRAGYESTSAILATIGVERVLDMSTVLIFFAILLSLGLHITDSLAVAACIAAAVSVLAAVAIRTATQPSRLRSALVLMSARLLPKSAHAWLVDQIARGLIGLSLLDKPLALAGAIGVSVLQWTCIVASIYLSVLAVGHTIPISAAICVWILLVLSLTLPSSPAQIGTVQVAYAIGMSLASTNDEIAFAASVVYVCTVNLPIMLIGGLIWLAQAHLRSSPLEQPHG